MFQGKAREKLVRKVKSDLANALDEFVRPYLSSNTEELSVMEMMMTYLSEDVDMTQSEDKPSSEQALLDTACAQRERLTSVLSNFTRS